MRPPALFDPSTRRRAASPLRAKRSHSGIHRPLSLLLAAALLSTQAAYATPEAWTFDGDPQTAAAFTLAQGWTSTDSHPRMPADLDGDGDAELVAFGSSQVFVHGLGESLSFNGGTRLTLADGWTSQDAHPRLVGDVNGDGLDDLVGCHDTETLVFLNDGSTFVLDETLSAFSGAQGWTSFDAHPRFLGDWNGDGRDDLIGHRNGRLWLALSTPTGFGAAYEAGVSMDFGWTSYDVNPRAVVDLDGDGLEDLVGFGNDFIFAQLSDGTGTGSLTDLGAAVGGFTFNTGWLSQTAFPRFLADVNADGLPDVVGIHGEQTFVYLRRPGTPIDHDLRYPARYANLTALRGWGTNTSARFLTDIDGDGAADLLGTGPDGLEWFLAAPRSLPTNPVVTENQQPGTEAWKATCIPGLANCGGGSDAVGEIEAYFGETSVHRGGVIPLRVSTNVASTFTLDVFRMGYYGGTGGRLITSIPAIAAGPQSTCPLDAASGRVECDWSTTHALQTGTDWVSGIYLAKLTRSDGYFTYAPFTLRDDTRQADFVYQLPITTYHAYNDWPDPIGRSLYSFNSGGEVAASQVSLDRPFRTDYGRGQIMQWDHDTIQWLEGEGYDVTYTDNLDLDRPTTALARYSGFLSSGHDEYWTDEMYDHVFAAREAGVDLAFFGSNASYWRIAFDANANGAPRRRFGRNGLFRNSSRREQDLMGIHYTGCCGAAGNSPLLIQPQVLLGADPRGWFWDGTGVETGDAIVRLVGYEVDERTDASIPPEISDLTLLTDSPYVISSGATRAGQTALLRSAASGAYVFAAGTMSWSYALARDDREPQPSTNGDPVDANRGLQLATINLLDRFLESPAPVPEPGFGLGAGWGAALLGLTCRPRKRAGRARITSLRGQVNLERRSPGKNQVRKSDIENC